MSKISLYHIKYQMVYALFKVYVNSFSVTNIRNSDNIKLRFVLILLRMSFFPIKILNPKNFIYDESNGRDFFFKFHFRQAHKELHVPESLSE